METTVSPPKRSGQRDPGPAHQRFVDAEGGIWIPNVIGPPGFPVRYRRAKTQFDPFQPTDDELLLAESFARLDLGDCDRVDRWVKHHGALDLERFLSGARSSEERWADPAIDTLEDLRTEQSMLVGQLELLLDLTGSMPGPEVVDPAWQDRLEAAVEDLTPRVLLATERVPSVGWRLTRNGLKVLELRDSYTWGSILGPITLQIFAGLRKLSERQPAAARCQECGLIFLTLDARRRLYCNKRHQHRYTQRLLRAAKAASRVDPT
jgi:hypothetical protein